MNIEEIKNKIDEIKNRKEVRNVSRVEYTCHGYKIYYTIALDYARKNNLQFIHRIYEYNPLCSTNKEIEYADTECIFIF